MALANNHAGASEKRPLAGRTRQAGLWPQSHHRIHGRQEFAGSFGGGEQGFSYVECNPGEARTRPQVTQRKAAKPSPKQTSSGCASKMAVRIAFWSLATQEMVEVRAKLSALAKDAVETTANNVGQADQPDMLQAQVEADEPSSRSSPSSRNNCARGACWLRVASSQRTSFDAPRRQSRTAPPERGTVHTKLLRDSPAVKIAAFSVTRADAELTRARRERIPGFISARWVCQ